MIGKKFLLAAVVVVFSLGAQMQRAQGAGNVFSFTVQGLNDSLRASGAKWKAGDTSMSGLSREEIKRRLGSLDFPDQDASFTANQKLTRSAPSTLDWRNKDGVNWVSPLLNQGSCGSCVAFATVATLETQFNVSAGVPGLNPEFSTQALFACGGGACEFGWFPHLAARHLVKTGVPDEACAPYTMGSTGDTVSCNSICKDSASRSVKITDFTNPSNGSASVEAVKEALQHGPLVTTLMVYDDFLFYTGGIYKHTTGSLAGGHAISLIGYEDATRSWIIRNSWGKEWGENGFAHVSWDDVSGVGNSTWGFVLPEDSGYIRMITPKNRNYVTGDTAMTAESTYADGKEINVVVFNSQGSKVGGQSCVASPCSWKMDSRSLQDGVYEAYATVSRSLSTGSKVVASQHERFSVLNTEPKMSISFKGKDGLSLDTPFKGRVEFAIRAPSTPVPMGAIEFRVLNAGNLVYKKSAPMVVEDMTMGWRTGSVPNGTYEIYFHGSTEVGSHVYSVDSNHATVTVAN